jgi:hypothetical protein
MKPGHQPSLCKKVLLDSTTAWYGEYWMVENFDCVDSWLIPGGLIAVCLESSVQSTAHYIIVDGSVSQLFCTLVGHLLDSSCSAFVPISWSCYLEINLDFSICQLKELLLLNPMGKPDKSYIPSVLSCLKVISWSEILGWSDGSYGQPSYAFRSASYGPEYFVTRGQRQITTACSSWQLFLSGSSLIFTWVKFLEWTREPYDIMSYSLESRGAKLLCMLHELENRWSYMEDSQLLDTNLGIRTRGFKQ